jgi:hypothetical protein
MLALHPDDGSHTASPGFVSVHVGVRVTQELLDVVGRTPSRADRRAQRELCRPSDVTPLQCTAKPVGEFSNNVGATP